MLEFIWWCRRVTFCGAPRRTTDRGTERGPRPAVEPFLSILLASSSFPSADDDARGEIRSTRRKELIRDSFWERAAADETTLSAEMPPLAETAGGANAMDVRQVADLAVDSSNGESGSSMVRVEASRSVPFPRARTGTVRYPPPPAWRRGRESILESPSALIPPSRGCSSSTDRVVHVPFASVPSN